jgi:anti-sigma-K factor RskA
MAMKECENVKLSIDYVEDGLTLEQRTDFEKHMSNCRSCLAEVQRLRKLLGLLSEDKVPAPEPSFWHGIEETIKTESSGKGPITLRGKRIELWKLIPVLVPVAAVLGFLILHQPDTKTVDLPISVNNVIKDVDLDRLMLGRIVDDDLVESMNQVEHYYQTELDEVIVEMDSTEQVELIQKITEQYVGKI